MSQGLCRGTVGWHVHGERSTAPVDSASVPLEHRLNVFLLSQLVPDRAVGDRRLDFFDECTSRGVLRRPCSERDQVGFAARLRVRIVGKSHASIVRRGRGQAVTGTPLAANARNGPYHAGAIARRARFVRERIRIGRYSTVMAGRKSPGRGAILAKPLVAKLASADFPS
jgi:hypothetical protein